MTEAPRHQGLPDVAPGVEPSGPMLDESLLKFLAHLVAPSGWQTARLCRTNPGAATEVFKSCAPAA